ncbi:MAG: alpha/beta fold hydrolase [Dehalococcoidia bacterium]|nr:alpha/beta fold hydrolase [Dehalococcoidia bacterium]
MALTDDGIIAAPGIMSRWVRLASGAKAHYVTSGDTGPAVILCHGGLPGSSGMAGWRFQLPFLGAHGFRVYAPDFPGYGHADTDPEHRPVQGHHSHVEFLRMFMDALCIEDAHFSGNSMGSSICWRFAISHPERVKNFVLIAGNIPGIVPPEQVVRTMSLRGLNRETFDGTPASMRKMMDPIIEDKSVITDDLLEMRTQAAIRQRESLAAYHAASDRSEEDPALQQRYVAQGRLDQLGIPHILLWGADDVLNPVSNAYLQEDLTPWIQYFYPEKCGHQGQTDQPDVFNQVFLDFFRTNRVSRAAADAAGVSKRRPELAHYVEGE